MARIIGVINFKGGVGKTTTASNLGAYLAAMGKYVLLVDLDPQANATAGLGVYLEPDHLNLYHALVDDKEPEAIIRKSGIFGYDILPAAPSLAGASVELVGVEERELWLKRVLNKIRTHYDYIILDSPPSLGLLTINGLAASEGLVIPVQCEYYALEGLSQLLNTIDLVRSSLNPKLQIYGVLLTMYDKRNALSQQVVKEVKTNFPGHVFEAIIPRSVSLAEAPSYGKTILQFDESSKGAQAYKQLAEEIIQLSEQPPTISLQPQAISRKPEQT
ncbi:MAG: hypothetical protein A3A33_03440 [Candidatus Yanofskybacteria bacterium RIFCSPLOWO2_01_FULL_49_25]|uniref:AAA domain-containing protein n=1 Tax=Candidatus Yanofskybacteria bacterium RIFCSPLOWO2_01_FULL_49_25 TaxID=1802701 RepID=A0A1F8GU66_9BACT|nr:MAG: hypothetical protein A3A33_03440 [Candidatus Yanofskybacteria bacterium RIFCSPLOWO2_01_FULL_49_25]